MSDWHSLYASTHNEAAKLLGQTKTKLAVALTALVPVVAALLLGNWETGVGVSLSRDLSQLMLSLFTTALLPLFLFMAAAESFSGEFADRTIKLVLLRPVSRAKAYASKVLALLLYATSLLALAWFVSLVAGLVLNAEAALAGLIDSLVAYATAFVAMAAVGSAASFVAQWLRSGVGALALCIVLYAGAKLLPLFFPGAAAWSFASYTDWHTLWIGGSADPGKLLPLFLLLLSSSMVSYIAGWFLFERKQC